MFLAVINGVNSHFIGPVVMWPKGFGHGRVTVDDFKSDSMTCFESICHGFNADFKTIGLAWL
jgi:hypothetical protein